ncbi:photosystem II biogenesis protein Psb29 [Cyanidioschyzon merolae strain 10D]|jgi:photosystem II biogenesis protein Psp29|uniref:Photosystem II biogenesis protein Psb29 n=1 Tax=Cyanidioschyzon merolae (strain NIES-3377 / 10D) TaxID=280699 RepID=M1VAS6_CYAM1|nr:photosystem II biogenesis protein Psb29 [Cyanidioschyzon merolae strain 10D]BAM79272.1 photosystem II biogenesis protein Psb29 [Cyanidioschyzon merolae strain 10D]|eukprot:XP_005535558.1 photosystem II biogenesis protein Psb29 [Cyanidioschyzon merolae strain 10D]
MFTAAFSFSLPRSAYGKLSKSGLRGAGIHAKGSRTSRQVLCAGTGDEPRFAGLDEFRKDIEALGLITEPADTDFARKFAPFRGKPVRTVSETVTRFYRNLKRPVVFYYQQAVDEILTTAHLALVCAMFRYDVIFALGFVSVYRDFFRSYPRPDERESLFRCICDALDLDVGQVTKEADDALAYVQGKTEAELIEEIERDTGEDSAEAQPVIAALRACRRADGEYYYTRLFGIGLMKIMSSCGVEINLESVKKWANMLKISYARLDQDIGTYQMSMEKLTQAEVMFKELEARERARIADELARKAQEAEEELRKREQAVSGQNKETTG